MFDPREPQDLDALKRVAERGVQKLENVGPAHPALRVFHETFEPTLMLELLDELREYRMKGQITEVSELPGFTEACRRLPDHTALAHYRHFLERRISPIRSVLVRDANGETYLLGKNGGSEIRMTMVPAPIHEKDKDLFDPADFPGGAFSEDMFPMAILDGPIRQF